MPMFLPYCTCEIPIYCKPIFIRMWENVAKFVRISLSEIFLTTNQPINVGNSSRLDNLSLRTIVSLVNREIKSSHCCCLTDPVPLSTAAAPSNTTTSSSSFSSALEAVSSAVDALNAIQSRTSDPSSRWSEFKHSQIFWIFKTCK